MPTNQILETSGSLHMRPGQATGCSLDLGPLHPLLVVRQAAHTGSALGGHSDRVILAGHCSEAPQSQGSEEEAEGSLVSHQQRGAWYHHLGNLGDTYGDSVSFLLPSGRLLAFRG